jgi:hypothetical protein
MFWGGAVRSMIVTVKQQQRPVGAVLAAKAAGAVPAAIAGKPAPTDE